MILFLFYRRIYFAVSATSSNLAPIFLTNLARLCSSPNNPNNVLKKSYSSMSILNTEVSLKNCHDRTLEDVAFKDLPFL